MASALGYNGSVQFALLVAAVLAVVLLVQYGKKISQLPVVKQRKEMTHVIAWGLFFGICGTGVLLAPPHPSGDPSVLLTIGAGVSLFGAVAQWVLPPRVSTPAPFAHRAGDFALLAIAALALRLTSTTRFQGYLPTDATGDGCYQLLEALTLGVHCLGVVSVTRGDVARAVAVLSGVGLLATQCYGDLDNNTSADQLFATSVYAEMVAWLLLVKVACVASNRRRFCGAFLLPGFASACCRLLFWSLAFKEVKPLKPILLMEYFPTVIIYVTALQMVAAVLAGLCLLLPKGEALVAEIEQALTASVGGLLPEAAGSKIGAAGFKPGRAIFEDGVLKVEYIAV